MEVQNSAKFIRFETHVLNLYQRKEIEQLFISEEQDMIFALDLTEVNFLDSSILGVFLNSQKKLALRNCELVVFGLTPAVRGLFKLTRLEYLIKVYESREAVIQFNRIFPPASIKPPAVS